MNCWASCIKGCNNDASREHYVSDGFFEGKGITAYGLHWCKNKPVKIGLASAVSKILCVQHNSSLSDYDNEAKELSTYLSESIRDKPLENNSININGLFLEKWALKTLFNLGYIGGLDQKNFTKLIPQKDLVSYLYSTVTINNGMGLYYIDSPISSGDYSNSISWNAIHSITDNNKIIGMTFTFNCLRFIINTLPIRAEDTIKNMGVIKGVDYSKALVEYRPSSIRLSSETAGTKKINLTW